MPPGVHVAVVLHAGHRSPAWRELLKRDLQAGLAARADALVAFAEPATAAEQVRVLQEHLARGVQGLILAPMDPLSARGVLRDYRAAGVKVVLVSTDLDDPDLYDSVVLTDNRQLGRAAAEFFAEVTGGVGRLLEVQGRRAGLATELRAAGFREVLARHPGLEIVESLSADWSRERALELVSRALERHPRLDGVFAHNDEMALGASDAAERAGRADELLITGVDAVPGEEGTIRFVSQGKLAATFLNPSPGKQAAHALAAALAGEPVAKRALLKTSLLRSSQRIRTWQAGRRPA